MDNYTSNPALKIWLECIASGSKEKEVQAFWENMLWTVYPAAKGWSNVTKYQQVSTEPDSKVMKVQLFEYGPELTDVLVVELKRLKEKVTKSHCDKVSRDQLDGHMAESTNAAGTVLFGAVGIGQHVQFYKRILPSGPLEDLHEKPLHLWEDCVTIQAFFDHFKFRIPGASPMALHEAGGPSEVISPTPQSTSQNVSYDMPDVYYYVDNGEYFLNDKGKTTPVSSRPQGVWVYNTQGWKDIGRTKKWRKIEGNGCEYS